MMLNQRWLNAESGLCSLYKKIRKHGPITFSNVLPVSVYYFVVPCLGLSIVLLIKTTIWKTCFLSTYISLLYEVMTARQTNILQ